MSRGRPGLNLLEAVLLICIVGTALAVFFPTFLERVRTNKILEASELLHELNARAASYYGTVWDDGLRRCLPPSAGPTPAVPSENAIEVDFFSEEAQGHASWEALGFQPARPIRYSYRFDAPEFGCGLGSAEENRPATFIAEGDLDSDDIRSRFERQAIPRADGTLEPVEELRVHRRVE